MQLFAPNQTLRGARCASLTIIARVLAPALAVLLLGLAYTNDCGGSGPTVQPPTNATLTITGASSSVNRTFSLGLTVHH